MNHSKAVQFTLSLPGSQASSRAPSPAPAELPYDNQEKLSKYDDLTPKYALNNDVTPGRLGRDVYDTHLSWWRAGFRRKLVEVVQWESVIIAKMQVSAEPCHRQLRRALMLHLQDKIRTPWLDAYFVYSSTLGTHTFFMILLPALFFFGYGEMARG